MMEKIAIVDTTFARFDMRAVAEDELKRQPGFGKKFELVRATVPGIKDLAVACKRFIETREPFDCACVRYARSCAPGRTQRPRSVARLDDRTTPYHHADSPGICA